MPRHEKGHEKNRLKNARLKTLSILPKSKKLKRPSNPEQAKEWLRDVADHLSNFINAGPGHHFVAYAIKRYLRDSRNLKDHKKARTLLYKELGLVELPGRRQTFKERMRERERKRTIVKLKDAGKPWHMIGAEVGLTDERSLKRIYKKSMREALQAKLDRAITHDLADDTFLEEESP